MSIVQQTVWRIEAWRGDGLSLAALAEAAGVSRDHLARAFGAASGRTPIRYARERRLTEAAKQLARGAGDVLTVALDARYGSHEAFTRAFRDLFGVTPETVRARGSCETLTLTEVLVVDEKLLVALAAPRFEAGRPVLVAGLDSRYTFETNSGIPAQWGRFAPWIGHVPGQIGTATYGVCHDGDGAGTFGYLAGVAVDRSDGLPPELTVVRVPAGRYAVFAHAGHVSDLRRTVYTIWNKWLPESGLALANGPDFERYGEDFDGKAGTGTIEIWLPIAG